MRRNFNSGYISAQDKRAAKTGCYGLQKHILERMRGNFIGPVAAAAGPAYNLDETYGTSVIPLAHFDASDMNGNGDGNTGWPTDDTGTVSETDRWKDRTGNYSLVQNAATSQGFYIDSAINSKPAVRSTDAENMKLLVKNAAGDASAEITASAGAYHIYHVSKVTSAANFAGVQGFYWMNVADSFRIDRRVTGAAVDTIKVHNALAFTLADFLNNDSWYEYRSYDDGGTNKILFKYHIDGSSAATTAGQASDVALDAEIIGYTSWLFNPQEDTAETIFFGSALSSDDKTQVESYLDAKYGITDS